MIVRHRCESVRYRGALGVRVLEGRGKQSAGRKGAVPHVGGVGISEERV